MLGMVISSFANGFGPLSIGPQVPYYMKEWDRSLEDVIQFVRNNIDLGVRKLIYRLDGNLYPCPRFLEFRMGSIGTSLRATPSTMDFDDHWNRISNLAGYSAFLQLFLRCMYSLGLCMRSWRDFRTYGKVKSFI